MGLGSVPGLAVDMAGQIVEELLDDPQVFGADLPRACAAATFGSFGGNISPVNAARGPNSSACLMRRSASPLEMRSPSESTLGHEVAPSSVGVLCEVS
jgi:hypothetical protein